MTCNHHDSEALQHYRKKVMELAELRKELGDTLGALDSERAQSDFAQFAARAKELEELRNSLEPKDLFIAKYGVIALSERTVSFVIPKGCSRIEILEEAQRLTTHRELIERASLSWFENNEAFHARAALSETIRIIGSIEGFQGCSLAKQKYYVQGRGLELPSLPDLAVAFAAFYVATGQPISGWFSKPRERAFWARAESGAIGFGAEGISLSNIPDDHDSENIGVAARIPPPVATQSGNSSP